MKEHQDFENPRRILGMEGEIGAPRKVFLEEERPEQSLEG